MGLFSALFGTYSKRQLKKLSPIADAIDYKSEKYAAMTDAELAGMTEVLRARLENGESLNDILPDAFATVREADARVLGKRPYYVQLLGGIVLHQGRIAEMKTGEGKTLVATMPAYLNALTGKGVHIVTVNDYLARRDSEEMGRVYEFLGLKTGLVVQGMSLEDKQAAYNADITYGTNNEFAFDYLRDNRVARREELMQRGHAFAIVDEVDSILIDEARNPLIISGVEENEEVSDLHGRADQFARTLKRLVVRDTEDQKILDKMKKDARQGGTDTSEDLKDFDDVDCDYVVDEKARTALLTRRGTKKAESYFGIENLSSEEGMEISPYINQALVAHGVMKRDDDYVVKDGQVIIVDHFTGRLMPGRRYNGGLHQAIEAKEGVNVARANRTLATITFQNYFRMYGKLSGMTGTALTEENEFREIYRLDVVEIPTNKPLIRKDHNDMLFVTQESKYNAIIERIRECQAKGQPVLVGTATIERSEYLSKLLTRHGIKHTILNAKHHEREAEIVAQAGQPGAVTISTNMAGRGTDILLGGNPEFLAKQDLRRRGIDEDLIAEVTGTADTTDEALLHARSLYRELYEQHKTALAPQAERVRRAGGLFILGSERHESRRIDNQLRGRSGRQGDPGESCFYLSTEDDLMRLFGSDRIQSTMLKLDKNSGEALSIGLLTNGIQSAQQKRENMNFSRRKHVLTYDDVMNRQREIIYSQRRRVLSGEDIHSLVMTMITDYITTTVLSHTQEDDPRQWNLTALKAALPPCMSAGVSLPYTESELKKLTREDMVEETVELAMRIYEEKSKLITEERMHDAERIIMLRSVDKNWTDHLEAMEDIQEYVGLNAYAQRDPVNEYRMQSAQLFDEMIENIKSDTARGVLSITIKRMNNRSRAPKRSRETFAGYAGGMPASGQKPVTIRSGKQTPKQNDKCPCGSGLKYKFCCGLSQQ